MNGFFPFRGLGHFFSRRDEVSNITFPDFDLDETDVGGELTWSPASTIGRALVWRKNGIDGQHPTSNNGQKAVVELIYVINIYLYTVERNGYFIDGLVLFVCPELASCL